MNLHYILGFLLFFFLWGAFFKTGKRPGSPEEFRWKPNFGEGVIKMVFFAIMALPFFLAYLFGVHRSV